MIEVQMTAVQMIEPQMPAVQMPGVQMIEPQMIEAVKTATSKMAVCQLEARMTLDLPRQNSNQKGPHKADWSDIAFSEWWTSRDYLYEGLDEDDGS